jgi:phospholipid/cholesterol/gamma-HCH transport system permease protein
VRADLRALSADGPRAPRWFGRLVATTGAATLRRLGSLLVFASFAATVVVAALRRTSWRRPVRVAFLEALHRVAVQSAPTVVGTGVLLGFVLVAQVVYWLETAGQAQLVGAIVVRVLVQEIAPVVVGLIVFGRVGTRVLIDLGEARPKGWLRQLERQGIDPVTLLVMPHMLAYSVGSFCLCTMLLITTLTVGYLVATALGLVTVPIWQFGQNVLLAMDLSDFIVPPAKCLVIGAAVALVCCATALARSEESYELQQLVPRGFVRAALAILLVNGIFDLAI